MPENAQRPEIDECVDCGQSDFTQNVIMSAQADIGSESGVLDSYLRSPTNAVVQRSVVEDDENRVGEEHFMGASQSRNAGLPRDPAPVRPLE
jgi:hypothetical protein